MQRHFSDDATSTRKPMLREGVRIEKAAHPKRATLDLQKREREYGSQQRLRQFLRIARGIRA